MDSMVVIFTLGYKNPHLKAAVMYSDWLEDVLATDGADGSRKEEIEWHILPSSPHGGMFRIRIRR